MPDTIAPYRADEVGSLLRTPRLKEARAKREKGEITPAQLKAVEDEEIRKIVKKQEEVGLKLATDGEFRRSWWHFDFFGGLKGVEVYQAEQGIQFKGRSDPAKGVRVTGKLDFPADHPMLEHFRFLKANTKVTPKMTIPAPPVHALPQRAQRRSARRLPGAGRLLRRPRQGLRQGHQGVLRCRLPLSAARRHRVGLPLLQPTSGSR